MIFHRKGICFIALTAICGLAMSQNTNLFNQDTIYVAGSGILYVNGGINTTGTTGKLMNEGEVYAKNGSLSGNFKIDSGGVVSGNGTYYVDSNWINNSSFIAQNSEVKLTGTTQAITGSQVTTFNNLTLYTSSSVKTQTIDAKIDSAGILKFNDPQVELATDVNTMFIENPSAGSIITTGTGNNTSFISSLAPGTLSRNANTTSSYLFPTGSSVGTLRYRPTEMQPTSATPSTYTDRFVNHDPNIDTYNRAQNDGQECKIDSLYYHAITRATASSNAAITFNYIQSADGSYDGSAHWQTSNTQWTTMGSPVASTSGIFNTLTVSNWAFTNPGEPYTLISQSPIAPTLIGDSVVCVGDSSVTFIASGGNGTYIWNLPSGVTITDSSANSITVDWGTGSGVVSVISTSASGGCSSAPTSINVSNYPSPTAYGWADTNNVYPNDPIQFQDSSQSNIAGWNWNFEDGGSSSSQNPQHSYKAPGQYDVLLTVTNQYGCTDTAIVEVNVINGVFIPNVFTPNGDGKNDVFYIKGGGFTEFNFKVYNRWGTLLFSSDAPQVAWDGRTNAGKDVSAGTYYFTLKAKTSTKDYSKTGYVTLFR